MEVAGMQGLKPPREGAVEWPRTVTCRCVSVYAGQLTYGRKYPVHNANDENIRIQNDEGRLRWYPVDCFDFSGDALPVVASVCLDNEVSSDLPVEVSIGLSDGQRRWCVFATPEMLKNCGDQIPGTDVRIHHGPNLMILSALSADLVESTVRYLESQGELLEHTLPLDPED